MSRAVGGTAPVPPTGLVLVEGASDAAVLAVLARRRGVDLSAWTVVVLGGATAARAALRGQQVEPVVVLALCDQREAPVLERALGGLRAETAIHVCRADLEDELVRAAGEPVVHEVLEATGAARSFATLQRQPAHRGRPFAQQVHRFIAAGSGRKTRIDAALAARLAPGAEPPPLAALLDRLAAGPPGDRPPAPDSVPAAEGGRRWSSATSDAAGSRSRRSPTATG